MEGDIKERVASYLCKMKGGRCEDLPAVNWKGISVTALGCLLGVGFITWLNSFYKLPLLVPSFGASAVLLYGACHVPMAQPRNVVGGHIISAAAGVLTFYLLGGAWWSIAVGVTAAVLLMSLTRTLHPPGGATAFMAVYSGQNFGFIFFPIGLGAAILTLIALITNNFLEERKYPHYWY